METDEDKTDEDKTSEEDQPSEESKPIKYNSLESAEKELLKQKPFEDLIHWHKGEIKGSQSFLWNYHLSVLEFVAVACFTIAGFVGFNVDMMVIGFFSWTLKLFFGM